MEKFTFHVIGLPHTACSKEYSSCAFTQKVLNFCKMMHRKGHTVYHYGGEGSTVECTEHITILTEKNREDFFWKKDLQQFPKIKWDIKEPYWVISNFKTTEEIKKRITPGDFICHIGGTCQEPIAKEFPTYKNVEFGIWYPGSFAPYRVFESYAWMHWTYGRMGTDDGRNFDAVIPNYFDVEDFTPKAEKDDYLLFIGRMINRKGPHVAVQIAKEAGMTLKMAWQGIQKIEGNKYIAGDVTFEGDHIQYAGAVGVKDRAQLMAGARAVIVPTTYIEPFGGVAIEALLSGTPVIATDYGAFTETIQHWKNGYRFRTLGEAVWAVQNLEALYPADRIQAEAALKYSLDVVAEKYQAYFEQLKLLESDWWYSKKDLSMYPRY